MTVRRNMTIVTMTHDDFKKTLPLLQKSTEILGCPHEVTVVLKEAEWQRIKKEIALISG